MSTFIQIPYFDWRCL